MSYVDLMGNTRWSEEQHVRRTEAMVRGPSPTYPSGWSAEDEAILNRKVVGYVLQQNTLTAQDLADIADFKAATTAAQAAGLAARADAAKLHAALDIEEAAAALAAMPPPPEEGDDPHAYARTAALEAHGALLVAASPEVLQLLDDRAAWRAAQNPPEPEPEEEPQP